MDNQTLSIMPKHGFGFVYCYTSPSGKKYIGKTKTTLKERAKENYKGYKGCTAFYNALQKYGYENFQVEILEEVPLERLIEAETQYIIDMNTTDPNVGYNIVTDYHEFLAAFNRIPVYSYDGKTGKFIEGFESTAEAERTMGVYRGSIRRILNVPNHHVRGRLWRTEKFEQVQIIPNNQQPNTKPVFRYDPLTGEFLQAYTSIREAAKITGFDRKTISDQVARKAKREKKYIFRDFKVDNLYNESSTTIHCGVDSSESKQE